MGKLGETCKRGMLLFLFGLILAFDAVVPLQGQAQFLPGTTTRQVEEPAAMEAVLEEARRKGSTIIMIAPQDQASKTDDGSAMRAERFLEARQNFVGIIASAHSLLDNAVQTFRLASPDGSTWWLWRALLTAAAGLLVGRMVVMSCVRWATNYFGWTIPDAPKAQIDRVQFLFNRTTRTLFFTAMAFIVALIVAVVLDSGHEPTRRVIFDVLLAFALYQFLRRGVSWNLFAPNAPHHRLVNLSDDMADPVHTHLHVALGIMFVLYTPLRSLFVIGRDQLTAGVSGGLTEQNLQLLQIVMALLVTLSIIIWAVWHFRVLQTLFSPADPGAAFYRIRAGAARLVPLVMLLYAIGSFLMFSLQLALKEEAPGLVIAAPFLILLAAALIHALVLMAIDAFYNFRARRFAQRVQAAQAERAVPDDVEPLRADEDMISGTEPPPMVYQPVFRPFLEQAALAVIATVALGELGRTWGISVGEQGNWWAAILDIFLSCLLGWIAYRAVCSWIDHRMALEGGPVEADEEEMGNEGGAGSSRTATLLPIIRYVLVSIIVVAAAMAVLSRFGVDIGPLFAGAGVVGIAVGFGAQTLIRDIFSGAFFLLDDAFRKGEYVEIEGIKGVVEKISIRSFQLRHHLGALHTIPFGEIRQLTNYSRDWVMMKLPLRVTYDTDVDKVRKLVKKLGQELLNHPQVGHTFMQPLKSQGVYKMEDSAMIIRVKFMTKPGEQFVTRKVVYESIQDLFAREGIHFAHKEVTVRLADGDRADNLTERDRQAVTAAARSVIDAEEEAMAAGGEKGGDGDR